MEIRLPKLYSPSLCITENAAPARLTNLSIKVTIDLGAEEINVALHVAKGIAEYVSSHFLLPKEP